MAERIALQHDLYAVVDAEDFERLSRRNWYCCLGYAVCHEGNKVLWMHREILQVPEGMSTDHIDGDTLNNTRRNLRIVTHAQNMWNRGPARQQEGVSVPHSPYKGVGWDSTGKKWRARITAHGKTINLGSYDREQDAAEAYDREARLLFGEYARLNLPPRRRSA